MTQNRFEGRSNYYAYYPTSDLREQKVEKLWVEAQNKELMNKRREEEFNQHMKEWSDARGRLEGDI